METDLVDLFVEQWNRQRPDLDPSALGVVSRVLMLAKHLEQSADRALGRYGLSLWQFDVLAALRRSGPPYVLSPSQIAQLVTLTSGAMTNRIDRLEAAGLVERRADPADRRGVLIAMTAAGLKLVNEAIGVRLEAARKDLATLAPTEQEALAGLLRQMLIANAGPAHAARRALRKRRSTAVAG